MVSRRADAALRRAGACCRRSAAGLGLSLALVAPVTVAAEIDGSRLAPAWALPFAGLLLSIALLPLVALKLWHHHYGKIAVGWTLLLLLPLAASVGPAVAADLALHALLGEYLPFIIFIGTLYVVAGGIHLGGQLHGSPRVNTTMLAIGGLLASVMGTTGAAMLLIRPLLRANDSRRRQVHTVVFFIIIVANIGGSLTPLGDPPLFLGFLKGISFGWTAVHMALPMLCALAFLLPLYFVIDTVLYRRDLIDGLRRDPTPPAPLRISGGVNFLLLALVVAVVLGSGLWRSDVVIDVLGQPVGLPGLLRDVLFLLIGAASLWLTAPQTRKANDFGWEPIKEVAKLFFGIFLTMAPVLLMLKAGADGPFAAVTHLISRSDGTPHDAMYFWLTGMLSSFLDNAPTYLVFFNLAGGDPQQLMTTLASTLTAISVGAVFMGANTYIGNAPNFMVKAIAEERGVAMPSFFGYMLWSGAVLMPLYLLLTLLFFR